MVAVNPLDAYSTLLVVLHTVALRQILFDVGVGATTSNSLEPHTVRALHVAS